MSHSQGRNQLVSWKTAFLISAAVAAAAGYAIGVRADETFTARRLIETSPGTRAWMDSAQISEISRKQHEAGKCGGFMDVTETVAAGGDALAARSNLLGSYSLVLKQSPTEIDTVNKLLPELSAKNINDTIRKLSSFDDRYYNHPTGKASAEWLASEYKRLSAGRKDVTVSFFQHNWMQPSIIARIEGKGPKAAEIVVVGGHQDSINHAGGDIAPGADDDASGSATVLEIFRVLVQSGYQPERSIEFMAYAAEEVGLLGSQAIAMKYREENKTVVGAMQFDMTMFPGTRNDPKITFITDNVDSDLTDFTKKLVDTYVKVAWSTDQCGYACSDHASWNRYGYASTFPFEAAFDDYNHNLHTERDTMEILDSNFGLSFAKLGLSFAVEMASK